MEIIKKTIDTILKVIMATSSLILFVVTVLQVAFRFILEYPLPWSQDVIRLCFTYLVFLGAAYCVKDNAHLGIDVVITLLKPKHRKILDIFISITLLSFFVFLTYYGFIFAMSATTQRAPYLPIPMSIYYGSIPLSAILMVYYMASQLVNQFINFNKLEEEKK